MVGLDVPLNELFLSTQVQYKFQRSYSFVIDTTGEAVVHPLIPAPVYVLGECMSLHWRRWPRIAGRRD